MELGLWVAARMQGVPHAGCHGAKVKSNTAFFSQRLSRATVMSLSRAELFCKVDRCPLLAGTKREGRMSAEAHASVEGAKEFEHL